MNDDAIRSLIRSSLDRTESAQQASSEDSIRAVAARAVSDGSSLLALRARTRGFWWLCAASVLIAFACVRIARREQRMTALVTAEAAWSL